MRDVILGQIHWIRTARQTAGDFAAVGLAASAAAWRAAADQREASLERLYIGPMAAYAARYTHTEVSARVAATVAEFRQALAAGRGDGG